MMMGPRAWVRGVLVAPGVWGEGAPIEGGVAVSSTSRPRHARPARLHRRGSRRPDPEARSALRADGRDPRELEDALDPDQRARADLGRQGAREGEPRSRRAPAAPRGDEAGGGAGGRLDEARRAARRTSEERRPCARRLLRRAGRPARVLVLDARRDARRPLAPRRPGILEPPAGVNARWLPQLLDLSDRIRVAARRALLEAIEKGSLAPL